MNARTMVFSAAMEGGATWPVRRRIDLYKSLALLAGNPVEAQPFLEMAKVLEGADLQHRELSLKFSSESNHTSNSYPS